MRWRIAGLATVAAFLVLIGRFWHPVYAFTSFLQLDAADDQVKIASLHEVPIYVYRNTGGYDGQYYAQIAYHPLLDSAELSPSTVDNLAYRARRILPCALSWLLAAGQTALIVHVYSLLNVGFWLALAALLWRILGISGPRAWMAWVGVLFSAGAIESVRFALPDLPAATLAAGALWAADRNRGGWASGLMAAASLSRETTLAAVPGLWRRPWLSAANARRTAAAVVPIAGWLAYIRWRLGSGDPQWNNFDWPFAGLVGKGADCIGAFAGTTDTLLVAATLLATLGLGVQTVYIAARPQPADRWWCVGAAYALMLALLGAPVWEGFPGASMRVLLPLTIAFNVLVVRRKSALAWLLAGNLGVAAGLFILSTPHTDPREIAAARQRGSSIIVRVGDGWAGREHRLSHVWSWCSGHGRLSIEAWPRDRRPLELTFGLHSLDERNVSIRDRGRLVWRGKVGPDLVFHTLPVTLDSGRAELDFSSDRPPQHESPALGGRLLAFEIYDLRIAVPAR